MGLHGFGRKLGVGVRVGGRILGGRAGQAAQSAKKRVPAYAGRSRAIAEGGRQFGRSFWRPFAHASGVLWLEVTGLFFALFALFFAQNAYRLRHFYKSGPQHQFFLMYAAFTAIFVYFTFTSFYKARKKEKLKRRQAAGAPASRS